ncbi:MAG: hypothetical protein HN729_09330 [Candidatus Marinimicrobia bacterium]|jgi:hypothetical protein|nr:hypothetical protein [Candidatus Neomarinimicrobiota bacterium]MBT3633214.1 hypothetical protein [Candidatus Neomarinimicrobiota bacterium]MBT3682185.1 hypothetical protein [Candidatus Neomarinimicrobiota bacterium]MBT3758814.1 hypothetical protein [Candidatus Neomarinimicrobiota bacterium]MBT3895311.1 hypothetical protein [Candidatus Neomarinimicrobiota bacterium]
MENNISHNVIPIVVAILIGGGIISGIAYYLIRFMRGSIKLSVDSSTFNSGETISGSFDLFTKKPIEGNKLTVSLIGKKVTITHRGGKRRTHTKEIYRDEIILEKNRDYPANYSEKGSFQMNAPNISSPDFLESAIGQSLTAAVRLLSNRQTYLKWKIEVRLDAKGVDLTASKKVTINISPSI